MKLQPWEENCLLLLSEMHSGNETAWSKGKAQLYLVLLRSLGEEWSRKVVERAVLTEEWRPAPAKLRTMAAILASPLPAVGSLWAEFWHKAIHANYRSPNWSHPLLSEMAKHLGGWRSIYGNYWTDTDTRTIDALHRRFEEAYRECAVIWREQVAEQLALPEEMREARLFPDTQEFIAPKSLPPVQQVKLLSSTTELSVAISAEFQNYMQKIRSQMKMPDARPAEHDELNKQQRESVERELGQVRARMEKAAEDKAYGTR